MLERVNQKWTIQRNGQHGVHKTKGQSKMDNPEKLATQGTQDEGAIKMDNPETLATQGTQDDEVGREFRKHVNYLSEYPKIQYKNNVKLKQKNKRTDNKI